MFLATKKKKKKEIDVINFTIFIKNSTICSFIIGFTFALIYRPSRNNLCYNLYIIFFRFVN